MWGHQIRTSLFETMAFFFAQPFVLAPEKSKQNSWGAGTIFHGTQGFFNHPFLGLLSKKTLCSMFLCTLKSDLKVEYEEIS